MMRQYLSVKAEYPGAIVLFRMGDFFETFFEDAEACSRLLDITLTARSKERDVPMAGVPHHAIESYLAKLIDVGKTVVLVDQVEDPRQAKGLVRRAVTRVLSPGTYLDPNAPARAATYLVALAWEKRGRRSKKPPAGFGLAALDLSTGEFRATAGEDEDLLLDELVRLGMRELLILEAEAEHPAVLRAQQELTGLTVSVVDGRDAASELSGLFGAEEAEAIAKVLPAPACTAAGMAVRYAKAAQMRSEAVDLRGEASLRHIETVRPYVPGDSLVLDAQATTHLELVRTTQDGARHGSLLGALDETTTAMGARLLVRWLLYPLTDVAAIRERQDAVAAWVASPSALDELREGLDGVADLERLTARVVMGRANPRDVFALAAVLERAPAVLAAAVRAAGEEPEAPAEDRAPSRRLSVLGGTDPLQDLAAHLSSALVHAPPVELDRDPVFSPGFDAELDELSDLATNGKARIGALEAREKEATGIASLKVRYNKVFGYYIEVTKANLSLVPEGYVRKQTTVNTERFFTEELKDLETAVLNAEERRVARTGVLFGELINRISAQVARLRALSAALAELDVLATFAPRRGEALLGPPHRRRGLSHPDPGRAAPRRRALLGGAGGAVRPERSRDRFERTPGDHHGTQHGGQVDDHAPDRADRDPRAPGRLRSGAGGHHRARGPSVHPGRGERRSVQGSLHLHGGDERDLAHPPLGHGALADPAR